MRATLILITLAIGCNAGSAETPKGQPETTESTPGGTVESAENVPGEAPPAEPSPDTETPGSRVELTYYHVAERPPGDPDEVRIADCDGALLTYASREFRAEVQMQRTGRAVSPSGERVTFNDVGGCYRRLDARYPWGIGVSGSDGEPYALTPFRSIAVDRDRFELGRWYYVRELDGVTMPEPSRFTHDGCVRAVDIGGAVDGAHIDFFVGRKSAYEALVGTVGESVTISDGGARCA